MMTHEVDYGISRESGVCAPMSPSFYRPRQTAMQTGMERKAITYGWGKVVLGTLEIVGLGVLCHLQSRLKPGKNKSLTIL